MDITIANSSGDPKLAMAMLRCMPIPQWQQLLDALAPVALPDGVQLLSVCFDERLPRTHFDQRRHGMFQSTVTGIDKQHFLAAGSVTELRDYLLDFVGESFERVDWPAETRQRASDIFRSWRATLPHETPHA
jgi:hypothetical protein